MTPKQVFPTHTGFGPIVRMELTTALTPSVELGPYLSFSSHPVTSIDGFPGYDKSGSVQVFSGGGTLKARFLLSPRIAFRAGGFIGVNHVNAFIARSGGGGEGMPGTGLQLGPVVDFRFEVSRPLALLLQLGFISQPIGSATFPSDTSRSGQSVDFAFPPMVFLAVGPELFFGQ
jgi:hypothetical protein